MGLLTPLAVGSRTTRNRVLFGPHVTNLGRGRAVSERHVAYYRRRAAGGCGIVVTEEASVHGGDWPYERAPSAADCAEGWAAVAGACREEGALAVAAIGHAGAQGSSAYGQEALWAPSRVPDVESREVPKEMEKGDIDAVIAGFGAATAIAVGAGMDGVEVNAGQHSLVRQYLSGLTNHRTDGWGTDRLRFAVAVIAAARDAAGGAVVGLRLCCDELAPWAGVTATDAVGMVAVLAPLVDYLVVVRGSIYSVSATRPDGHEAPGFNRDLTAAMRGAAAGATPVFLQGSVVDVAAAEEALAAGVCDGVEMTRAQIADPDLVAKVTRGEGSRVRPCLLCNQTCMVRDVRNPLVTCVVEPSAGHETEEPPDAGTGDGRTPRRSLLVVGAGPAGLETARVAARAGLDVTVVDRRPAPGGQVPVAARAAGRSRLTLATDWLTAECRALGVTVATGRTVHAGEIAAHDGPVVLCTGARPAPPPWPGDAPVVGAAAWLTRAPVPGRPGGEGPESAGGPDGGADGAGGGMATRPGGDDDPGPGDPLVVWDPLGGPIGVSVAETAAANGHDVVLVTPDHVAGSELARTGDLAPADVRLRRAGVGIVPRSRLVSARPGTVTLTDRHTGASRPQRAGLVVDCGPLLPDDRLWRETGAALPRAGDAVAPRGILEAVLEGRRRAREIVDAPLPPPSLPGPATRPAGP